MGGNEVNKAELCAHMVVHFAGSKLRLTRDDAREFLNELERVCRRRLMEAGHFRVPGVVKLVVQERRPRKGRSPVTGAPMGIPARLVVKTPHRGEDPGRRRTSDLTGAAGLGR